MCLCMALTCLLCLCGLLTLLCTYLYIYTLSVCQVEATKWAVKQLGGVVWNCGCILAHALHACHVYVCEQGGLWSLFLLPGFPEPGQLVTYYST